jgi:ATP-binding cassette subfamily G (WHITE) protein 2 (PDR)
VTVLYEGRQIFFGPCNTAKSYFSDMGFECAPRQTTADFLTSLSPAERLIKPGFENKTPRTAEEFAIAWKSSQQHGKLMLEIAAFDAAYPVGGKSVDDFEASRIAQQAKQQ